MSDAAPLTLGTAGHIDHGKTALVAALTGVDTDRLPQEQARGISIELGYAALQLPSGRRLSVVDVPGHERFVRTMVAGASGIDLYLMVIAADDGVMPQTREHAAVLAGLGVQAGIVAVTKTDLSDPDMALLEAGELLPGAQALAVSARSGAGLDDLRAALDRLAATVRSRADAPGEARLHVDRVFTIRGAGTVVTGTLWSGQVAPGDALLVLPAGLRTRARGVQVHDEPVQRAAAGQRVAINLVGVEVGELARGDVVVGPQTPLEPRYALYAALDLHTPLAHGARVQVHHGTRESPARVRDLGGGRFRLRLERALLAATGDRLVVRRIAPPDTLGGGVVLAPPTVERDPEPAAPERQAPEPLSPAALELEARLRAAGFAPPLDSELGPDAAAELAALRAHGRAVRVARSLHFHVEALAEVQRRVVELLSERDSLTLAELRDELGSSRKFAQALLEHFDSDRLTRRVGEARVLRRN